MQELFGLEGEPALVVGGGNGIGRETARLLAKVGARVAVADVDPARAERVADEIGGHPVVGDVTVDGGPARIVEEARDVLGGLTRVANIVGLVDMRPFAETDPAQWQAQFQMNLYHHLHVCQAAGRHLLEAGGGVIAMVASVSGMYGARNHAAYGIAKAGVMSLARTLSAEWAGRGVRINTVAPDITATPRLVEAMPVPPDEAIAAFDAIAVADGVPMRRFGRPEEIAGPLLFLLSDLSSFMTGQCLVVDGGTMVRFPHGAGEGDGGG